ncbi:hypothetical protein ACWCYZ_39560 [Streptomyces virginiae]
MSTTKYAVVTLGAREKLEGKRSPDPMGREFLGWDKNMTPEDTYRDNRGIWPFVVADVEACEYVLFVSDGLVRLIIKLTGTESGYLNPATGKNLRAFVGDIVTAGPVYDQWFEQPNPSPARYPLVRFVNT